MNRTRRIALAAGLAAALATPAAVANATPAAHLTVDAAGQGASFATAHPQPDGVAILAIPHDGIPRSIYLDAASSTGADIFWWDTNGDGVYDNTDYNGWTHNPYKSLYEPDFDTVLHAGVTAMTGAGDRDATNIAYKIEYQPEARLNLPSQLQPLGTTRLDATGSMAWDGDGVPRPVASYVWHVDHAGGDTDTTTTTPYLNDRFSLQDDGCVTVQAFDVSGAASLPVTKCATVALPSTVTNAPPVNLGSVLNPPLPAGATAPATKQAPKLGPAILVSGATTNAAHTQVSLKTTLIGLDAPATVTIKVIRRSTGATVGQATSKWQSGTRASTIKLKAPAGGSLKVVATAVKADHNALPQATASVLDLHATTIAKLKPSLPKLPKH
jgi:hypothetical protein